MDLDKMTSRGHFRSAILRLLIAFGQVLCSSHYSPDYQAFYYCNFPFRLWKLLQATVETVMRWRMERWRLSSLWLVSQIISTSELRITWNPQSLKTSKHYWRRPRRRLASWESTELREIGECSDRGSYCGAIKGFVFSNSLSGWASGTAWVTPLQLNFYFFS